MRNPPFAKLRLEVSAKKPRQPRGWPEAQPTRVKQPAGELQKSVISGKSSFLQSLV